MTAFRGKYTYRITEIILHTFKNSYISGSGAFVVAYQSTTVVGVGTDNCDVLNLGLIKGKESAFVLKENRALLGSLDIELVHGLTVYNIVRNVVKSSLIVAHNAELKSCGKEIDQSFVETFLGHEACLNSFF